MKVLTPRSPNETRSSPMRPASSHSSIGSSTIPKSSTSKANPITSKRPESAPKNATNNAPSENSNENHYRATNQLHRRTTLALFDILQHWSADQALAVYELLETLAQSVWGTYLTPLIELIQSQSDKSLPTHPGPPV